jgi:hypothetical protein
VIEDELLKVSFTLILINRNAFHRNSNAKTAISQTTTVLCSVNTSSFTAAPAMHYDQIAPSRRGGIDDCLIDVIVLDVKRIAGDTC